jgi:hypothetical protein
MGFPGSGDTLRKMKELAEKETADTVGSSTFSGYEGTWLSELFTSINALVISTPKGNVSYTTALPKNAVLWTSSREGMFLRYSSCSIRISFSTSWGVAPGHWVRMEIVRASISGIICTGILVAANTPMMHIIKVHTTTGIG